MCDVEFWEESFLHAGCISSVAKKEKGALLLTGFSEQASGELQHEGGHYLIAQVTGFAEAGAWLSHSWPRSRHIGHLRNVPVFPRLLRRSEHVLETHASFGCWGRPLGWRLGQAFCPRRERAEAGAGAPGSKLLDWRVYCLSASVSHVRSEKNKNANICFVAPVRWSMEKSFWAFQACRK